MRTRSITLLVAVVIGAAPAVVNADTSGPAAEPAAAKRRTAAEQRSDRRRVVHAVVTGGIGAVYLVSEFAVKDKLIPEECVWCDPPGFDADVRDALRWDHPDRASLISGFTGYVIPPLTSMGLLVASSWCDGDKRRMFDDVMPVLETAVVVGIINQTSKFIVGRARPLARFGEPGRPAEEDDNTSFFSGHTALVFAETVAAGMVARRRGYRLEPVIWATGLTLGVATGYLRIAADKHYLSDVVTGAAVGTLVGLVVPQVFHTDVLGDDVAVVPTGNGLALTGTF